MKPEFWSQLPLGNGVELITADAHGLGALAKPAGVLSHPNMASEAPRALLTVNYDLEAQRFTWEGRKLWLLNRLDSATSGVILVAASEKLALELRAMFLRKQVRKVYNALVFGQPHAAVQVWKDKLAVQKRGGQIRTEAGGNVPAESHMRVLKQRRVTASKGGGAGEGFPLALIQLEPRTGRSHQLHVQCAQRHLPIVGDATYGDFEMNRAFAKTTGEKRLFLHSLETSFEYAWGNKTVKFSARAPLPEEFG